MTLTIVKSRQARQEWRDMLDKVQTGEDVIIERNGKRVAAVIPAEDYELLQEELEDLRIARRAGIAYESWKNNPDTGKPYVEFRSQLVDEGLLDE
jgi:prevent-host-death family protein